MSLRWKIAAALMLLAGLAAIAIGTTTYVTTAHELTRVIDRSLEDAARFRAPGGVLPDRDLDGDGVTAGPGGRRRVVVQVIDAQGNIILSPASGALPISDAELRLAASGGRQIRRSFEFDDEQYRGLTVAVDGGGAVQYVRSTDENERALHEIRDHTLAAVIIVMALAAIVGLVIGRQVTRRLRRLTATAGEVAATGRLDIDVPTEGADETGQLGRAFSGMLAALAGSRAQQHQLIQDAGHELRTPLTSLRTNVAVLRRFDQLDETARTQMIADLDSETRELTSLVNELVELATDRRDDEPSQIVRLGELAERAAARTRRRTSREIVIVADDALVDVRPSAIERALQNLIDNAVKFAPTGAVEVSIHAGTVTVRDHGPGVPATDLGQIFDRFYRSVESRSLPGSGLGLSIVKSIVESHSGTVFARNAAPAGSGAEIGFTIPLAHLPAEG
jgi:two-component system, OmpR family, sensor histidine kinase MprB